MWEMMKQYGGAAISKAGGAANFLTKPIVSGLDAAGRVSSLTTSLPGLGAIGLLGGMAGFGKELSKDVENTDIRDIGQLKTLKKGIDVPGYGLAGAGVGAFAGSLLGKNKKTAALGAAIGGVAGMGFGFASNEGKAMTMSVLGGGLALGSLGFIGAGIAKKIPHALNRQRFFKGNYQLNPFDKKLESLSEHGTKMIGIGAAPLVGGAALLGLSSQNVDVFGQRSLMNFALKTKQADQSQNMTGTDMAQINQSRVRGPMLFGSSSPRNYSLGATGDLALALHHKRHG